MGFNVLIDMEASYAEYEEWSEEPIPETTIKNYKKALQQLEKCKPYEEALVMLAFTPSFKTERELLWGGLFFFSKFVIFLVPSWGTLSAMGILTIISWEYWKLWSALSVPGHPEVHMRTLGVFSSMGLKGIKPGPD